VRERESTCGGSSQSLSAVLGLGRISLTAFESITASSRFEWIVFTVVIERKEHIPLSFYRLGCCACVLLCMSAFVCAREFAFVRSFCVFLLLCMHFSHLFLCI